MPKLFISHSTEDDAFVRELQQALGDQGVSVWIDSRELLPGGLLAPDITRAIDEAAALAVVVSPASLQSRWVDKEVRYAIKLQKKRGREKFPVIPLSLDGTKLGVLEEVFGTEPTYIPVRGAAGGAEAAVHPLLVAPGRRKSADVAPSPQPTANPLEELVLELTDLRFEQKDGVRRASAHARLIYEPATPGQPHIKSDRRWRLVAPIGPIEAEELRWYLEKFAIWPSDYFRDRARKVEENLGRAGALPGKGRPTTLPGHPCAANAGGREDRASKPSRCVAPRAGDDLHWPQPRTPRAPAAAAPRALCGGARSGRRGQGHARTLALLAPSIRNRGVDATRAALVDPMAAMEKQFPGSREHSLFASVELSLRRMSSANRDKARVLGVFHGGLHLVVLCMMMQ